MDRASWLNSTDPAAMAAHLGAAWDKRMQAAFAAGCNAKCECNERLKDFDVSSWLENSNFPGCLCDRSWRAALIRELAGDPHRPAIIMGEGEYMHPAEIAPQFIDPATLRWHGGTIPNMARSIRGRQAWDEMPLLADALEDAGCTDQSLWRHLKGQEPCPACEGNGGVYANRYHPTMFELIKSVEWAHCVRCAGTGTIAARCGHVRGCWALRVLAGE